jgi:predicted nucleotidyltransferase
MDTAALLEKKKEILKIAAKHGARNIRIFGSVAEAKQDRTAMWTSSSIWNRAAHYSIWAAC